MSAISLKGLKARMVVKESIYHEIIKPKSRPFIIEPTPRSYPLSTDEYPYQRTIELDEEWMMLPHGWAEQSSMLIIENEEGDQPRQFIPTKEELEDVRLRIVEIRAVAMSGHCPSVVFAEIHPGDPALRFRPTNTKGIQARSKHGKIQIRLTLMPI